MDDLKHLINNFHLSKDKKSFLNSISLSDKAFLLEKVNNRNRKVILDLIQDKELLNVLEFLDHDDVVDVLQVLPEDKRYEILNRLNKDQKEKVNFLLDFAPDTAAGIMSLNYIIIEKDFNKKEIISRIKKHVKRDKKEPTVLVVDKNNKLLGELRISSLLSDNKNFLDDLKEIPSVNYDLDQKDCIELFNKVKGKKLAVEDRNGAILGIIHSHDLIKIIEEENTKQIYKVAGLKREEDILDGPFKKVKFRIGWLSLNLATALVGALVISFFEHTITKFVLLAAFMPIIVGMGGNSGTQTSSILIRSLALKNIDMQSKRKILFSEILGGIFNGTIISVLIFIVAMLFQPEPLFSFVIALAAFLTIVISVVLGTLLPFILKALGYDPASSATAFVITIIDILGFTILLGLATLILL